MEKLAIVLEKQNGEYVFKEVSELSPKSKNCVSISKADYNKIAKGESISLKEENISFDENINLVCDAEALYNQVIKTGISEEEASKKVMSSLQTAGNSFSSIKIDSAGPLTSIDIEISKEKKLEDTNEKKEEKKESDKKNPSKSDSEQQAEADKLAEEIEKMNPDEIISNIEKKVIAQDDTVETLVRNIYNNQKVINTKDEDLISTSKANILLDGPTGTGKTLIMKEIAKNLSLPIIIKPATMYTSTGYRGVELQEMLTDLLDKANGNLEVAQRGVIVLDEFDKLGSTKDESLEIRKAVQEDFLTYLSGGKFNVEYKGKNVEFDTSKITFICMGAFTDLREYKEQNEINENNQYTIKPEDYINAGIMRELVGRFSLITSTNSLKKANYIKILTDSELSPLSGLKELAAMYDCKINCDDAIIEKIAEQAAKENTGARSLQTVVNAIKDQILADLNAKVGEITITQEMLDNIEKSYIREGVEKNEI